MDQESFEQWYNTGLPLKRFKLDQVGSMYFEVLNVKREGFEFNYKERIEKRKKKDSEDLELKYYLDFDGYAGNIPTNDILPVLDKIHDIIHDEWENNTIKQPVQEWMDKET